MLSQLFLLLVGIWGLLVFGQKCMSQDEATRQRKNYIIFISVFLILQSGLRNLAVGTDTIEYSYRFEYYGLCSWDVLWQEFLDSINGEGRDAGYGLLNKAIYTIYPDFQVFLMFVAIFFFIVLGRFTYRNTTSLYQVFLSLCFYQLFFYTFFSITGIRQTIAVGLTLWSYEYIVRRKLVPFLLIVLIASTLHKTSLIFIPFYWLAQVKIGRTVLICALVALPFLMGAARSFAFILADAAGDYSGYAESTYASAGGPNYLIMLLILAAIAYSRCKYLAKRYDYKYTPYINALAVTIALAPLVWVDPSFLRLSYYYSIFFLALFPHLIESLYPAHDMKAQTLVTIVVLTVFSFIIIRTGSPYGFFWTH